MAPSTVQPVCPLLLVVNKGRNAVSISGSWSCLTTRLVQTHLSRDMRFSTMSYVRPAKTQISLRIRAVWSEPLLVAWMFYEFYATDWTAFEVSKLKRRLHRLVWVNTWHNASLLEITCRGPFYMKNSNMNTKAQYDAACDESIHSAAILRAIGFKSKEPF